MLEMITILNQLRIAELCSKNGRTLVTFLSSFYYATLKEISIMRGKF